MEYQNANNNNYDDNNHCSPSDNNDSPDALAPGEEMPTSRSCPKTRKQDLYLQEDIGAAHLADSELDPTRAGDEVKSLRAPSQCS